MKTRDHVKGGALTETIFFILLALFEAKHGYGIMQFIEEETKGRLVLGAGTLYGTLKTLDKKGWIVPIDTEEAGFRKKEYLIMPIGKEVAMQELDRLKELIETAQVIMIGEE